MHPQLSGCGSVHIRVLSSRLVAWCINKLSQLNFEIQRGPPIKILRPDWLPHYFYYRVKQTVETFYFVVETERNGTERKVMGRNHGTPYSEDIYG